MQQNIATNLESALEEKAKAKKSDKEDNVVLYSIEDEGEDIEQEQEKQKIGNAVVGLLRKAGIDVRTDKEEMQKILNDGDILLAKKLSNLQNAENIIKSWLENQSLHKTFVLELPQITKDLIRKRIGISVDNHIITSDGIRHGLKNHGVNGKKLKDTSIPIRVEDAQLIPYIMTAPDRIEKGSIDNIGRDSIRFIKTLSNGVVVVVEKENITNPNDMETINIWAEMPSSNVTNAYAKHNLGATSETVTISIKDATKIRKDAENAIEKDNYLQKMTVWHGS
ncbi:MAG: hypothetical protein HUK18_03525, partial [Bacteroidales bacterium]|nr:hypothetical protein [Bacteroidales bacterium]MCF0210372.1 hypothetical protein [Bacteroidales bacterium]